MDVEGGGKNRKDPLCFNNDRKMPIKNMINTIRNIAHFAQKTLIVKN